MVFRMRPDKQKMAGLEVLFSVAKDSFRGQNDALVCCLHWNMISNGYRCIGKGEKVSLRVVSPKV